MSAGRRWPEWFDPDDDRTCRAVWSRICEPGDEAAGRLVLEHGPGPALKAVVEGLRVESGRRRGRAGERGDLAEGWRLRLATTDPRRDLATLARFGGRLVVPGDPEWPDQLDDLQHRTPYCLWLRGEQDLRQVCGTAIAVVGSRAATEYGEHMTVEIAGGVALRGVTIVSGAAFGVDVVAHRAALAVGAATVAVLACGVDRAYPRSHETILGRVADAGVVVSEVPPASAPTRWRFVERNRLIAALSSATVVVEAAWRSGALVTAREAEDLSRAVGAVPGSVRSVASAGCHRLLRDRHAVLVRNAQDAYQLVAPLGTVEDRPPTVEPADHDDLSPVDRLVLDAVPLRQPAGTVPVARAAGLAEPEAAAALGRLELRGLVARDRGGWRRARRRRRGGA